MRGKRLSLLALSAILLLVGCGDTKEEIPSRETEWTTVAEETFETELPVQTAEVTEETAAETEVLVWEPKPVDVSFREKYNVVLEQYRETMLMDSEEYITLYWNWKDLDSSIQYLEHSWDQETCNRIKENLDLPNVKSEYPFVNNRKLYYMHQYKGEGEAISQTETLQYAYYDVDGNGCEELIVGSHITDGGYSVVGLYALANDAPITVDNTVGDRSHLTIYTDGTIGISGSSSASSFSVDYYKLDDYFGAFLDSLCSFTIDTDNPGADKIRELERQFEAELIPVEKLEWQPLLA